MQLFGVFFIVGLFSVQVKSHADDIREGRSWRLPNATYPLKYHLHIITWIHQGIRNFTGNAIIELMVRHNTSELVLHAKDLNIQKIYIQDLTTREKFENPKQRQIDDLLIIERSPQSVRNYINEGENVFLRNHRLLLELHYTGILNSKYEGFSNITYYDEKNETIYGAVTQMAPYYARKVLPCYDEIGLKANFTVSITHGNNYTALSNMPAVSTVNHTNNNMITTSFMETPPMSTYLLGFFISNYKFIERKDNGILQRVFLPPTSANYGDLLLTNAINVVGNFTRLMNVSYSLPKLDHINTRQHKFAAMENWGLITYNEKAFINDNKTDNRQQIITQNHEIIHQWFGNLVTPAWWDSLWLKEGFPSYYNHVLANMTNPEYAPLEWFNLQTCYMDKHYDYLTQIDEYVEKPDDILNKYTTGVYDKAPCIIQMFEHAFGESIFRKGISNYLKAYAFSTANGDQLFDHLQAALIESNHTNWNYSARELMKPWFSGKTLPIVTIQTDNNNSNIIRIQQHSSIKNITELWWIPLNFATATQPNFENTTAMYYMPSIPEVRLNLNDLNITLNANDDWLLVNIKSTGFYRVHYDIGNLNNIAKALQTNHNVINKYNRGIVLRSIFNMWTDGDELSLVTALELLKYLPQEQDFFVWSAIKKVVNDLEKALYYTTSYELYKEFMRNNVRSQYLQHNRNITVAFGRPYSWELLQIACPMDLPECLDGSKTLYMTQKKTIFTSDTQFAPLIICYAAKILNNTEFEITLHDLMNEPADLNINYWQHLQCTEIRTQYEKLLKVSLSVLPREHKRQNLLYFWANLLQTENIMKWNLSYEFLRKQIPPLQSYSNATLELCFKIKSQAQTIRKPFYAKYIELLKLCTEQLLVQRVIQHSSDIQPSLSEIGENFSFEHHPLWQEEEQKVYEWLKTHSRVLKTNYETCDS